MNSLRFLTPAELRAATPAEPEWIWQGFAARGSVTLLGGKPKCGKSTLILAAVDAITSGAPTFLGRQVNRTPVIYASEENAVTLTHKLPSSSDVRILTRDNAWPKPDWADLVAAAIKEATDCGAGLVVIDTLAFWAAMAAEREKDAGAAQIVMQPLLDAARLGIGFVVPVHQRKGGGDDGEGLRGSSAFAGAADIVIEIERTSNPRQRALLTLSRYPSTPGTLVVSRDPSTYGWSVVGEAADRGDARSISDRQALIDALNGGDALTRQELEDATGTPARQWHKTLEELQHEHVAVRTGGGKKGDPYRFEMVRTNSAQAAAQQSAETAQEVRLFSAAHPVGVQQKHPSSAPSAETAQCAESELSRRSKAIGELPDDQQDTASPILEAERQNVVAVINHAEHAGDSEEKVSSALDTLAEVLATANTSSSWPEFTYDDEEEETDSLVVRQATDADWASLERAKLRRLDTCVLEAVAAKAVNGDDGDG